MTFNTKDWKKINNKEFPYKLLEKNKDNHSIIDVIDNNELPLVEIKNDKLKEIPFALKDNMAMDGVISSAASKIIRKFKPNFNSTALIKLMEAGAIPVVKANLDELAMGGSGLVSNYGKVYHPYIKNGIIGGSSSGSAFLVANGDLPFSIGTDTGDSVRKPAALSGIVGFKPTWGLVSRYGIYDFAPTWDTLSWFTNTVKESAVLLDVLKGYDEKDATSIKPEKDIEYENNIETSKKFKLGYIKSIIDSMESNEIKNKFYERLERLEKDGHTIIELKPNLNILERILIVYRIISSVEAFSVNSNLTGFLFGEEGFGKTFEDQIIDARTTGFGFEVKKRFMFAMESIINNEEIYHKAAKVRTLIIEELDEIFKSVDAIVMPANNKFKPLENDKNSKYGSLMDDYLGLFNANGSPSITIPTSSDKTSPIGINISTKPFNDLEALQIAHIMEGYNE